MLEMLLESGSRSQRRTGPRGAVASVAVHTLVIVGAVVATAPAAHRLAAAVEETHLVFLPQVRPPAVTPPVVASVQVPNASSTRWSFTVPTVVPPAIPPIEPGPVRSEETGATVMAPSSSAAPPNAAPGGGRLYIDTQVERPVVPYPDNAPPRYPPVLQSAALEGEVVARFIVDTVGRVEVPSIEIGRSSHDLFERAVREALARARFHPAQIGGAHVRQLVEQRFEFSIRKP